MTPSFVRTRFTVTNSSNVSPTLSSPLSDALSNDGCTVPQEASRMPAISPQLNNVLSFSDALSATDAQYHRQVLPSTGARPRVSCHAVPRVAWSRARCCPLFSVVGARRIYPPLEDPPLNARRCPLFLVGARRPLPPARRHRCAPSPDPLVRLPLSSVLLPTQTPAGAGEL